MHRVLTSATACLLLLLIREASAQSPEAHGRVALASELTERGVVRGTRRPVLQGEVSVLFSSQWSASAELSGQGERLDNQRIVLRGSRYWALSRDWQVDASLAWYGYPSMSTINYAEMGTSVGFRDVLSFSLAAIRYTSLPGGSKGLRWAIDTGARWPLNDQWSLTAALGASQVPNSTNQHYVYGSAGIAWQYQKWNAGLVRIASNDVARQNFESLAPPTHWSGFVSKDF